MVWNHKLKYAGAKPYRPERERSDISRRELEQLEQDETYQKLAQVRWLADELEKNLDREAVPNDVVDEVFVAVGDRDAPLRAAVETYVDEWLANHRDEREAKE